MGKEAVVYILDASSSMAKTVFGQPNQDDNNSNKNNTSNDSKTQNKTRLQVAKEGIQAQIADLMFQSTQNECSVIVLRTQRTCHHLYQKQTGSDDDDDSENSETDNDSQDMEFPNLTELPHRGVSFPNVSLLRQIKAISGGEDADDDNNTKVTRGDFVDGLILAADALQARTARKQYQRSIVLWTDCAGYSVALEDDQLLQTIDSLRSMDAKVFVVGMDFTTGSVDYSVKAEAPTSSGERPDGPVSSSTDLQPDEAISNDKKRTKRDDDKEQPVTDSDTDEDMPDSQGTNDDNDHLVYETPHDCERLLQSITEKTGGRVLAATTLRHVLRETQGQKGGRSPGVAYKMDLQVAPGLIVNVRQSLWTKKPESVKFIREAVDYDEYLEDDKDENMEEWEQRNTKFGDPDNKYFIHTFETGEEVTQKIEKKVTYLDLSVPKSENVAITYDQITQGLRYGSDLIPLSDAQLMAMSETKIPPVDGPCMQILGYVPRAKIPRAYLQGPVHRIFSHQPGKREDVALHALKHALVKRDKVAIATFTKKSWPSLGAIFPNSYAMGEVVDDVSKQQPPLLFLQLPYAGDTKDLPDIVEDEQREAAQQLQEDDKNDEEQNLQTAKNMIQSLMLNSGDEHTPVFGENPYNTALNRTLLQRAMDPEAPCAVDQVAFDMQTPPQLLKQAKPALQAFREAFPVQSSVKMEKATATKGKAAKGRKKVLTYTDFL